MNTAQHGRTRSTIDQGGNSQGDAMKSTDGSYGRKVNDVKLHRGDALPEKAMTAKQVLKPCRGISNAGSIPARWPRFGKEKQGRNLHRENGVSASA